MSRRVSQVEIFENSDQGAKLDVRTREPTKPLKAPFWT